MLLLHMAAQRHWGAALIPVLLSAGTSALLAVVGASRERALRIAEPAAMPRLLPAVVSLAVTATSTSVFILH